MEEKEIREIIKDEIQKTLPKLESALIEKITTNLSTSLHDISQALNDKL